MAITPFTLNRFRIAFAAWWLIWIGFQSILIYSLGFSLLIALLDSFATNLLLAGCCLLVTINLKYYQPKQERYWFILVLSIVLSALWQLTSSWLMKVLIQQEAYQLFFSKTIPVRFGIGFLLTGCMAMISLVWYSLQEQKEIELRKRETEKLAKDAELFKLRNQLQPHFLFNSLNSINALIGINPEQARKMVQQLAEFLRGSIRREEQLYVSVAEELEHLDLYLSIEKQRFGHRLSTAISIEDDALGMKLPNMLLQPIVENSIKFGLYDTIGNISIHIHAKAANGILVIQVENPYDPETANIKPGEGFGLSSVRRRLELLFSRSDLFETSTKDAIFTAIVHIPQPTLTT